MKHIVVIGGTGRIGKKIVKFLQAEKKYSITVLTRHSKKISENENICFHTADLLSPDESLQKILHSADIVINASGYVSFLQKNRKKLQQQNETTVQNIISILEDSSRLERYIHIGSAAKYGIQQAEFSASSPSFFGENPHHFPYSYSKYQADILLEKVSFSCTCIHPSFVVDDDMKHSMLQKTEKIPFLIVPPGKNGITFSETIAQKIVQIITSNHYPKSILLVDEVFSFRELLLFFGIQKPIFLLPFWSKKILIPCVGFLEKMSIPISREQMFFGFCTRHPLTTECF